MAGRWHSIKEAAERLGVSHDTISRMIERGELPAIRVSERIVRIPTPALQRYEEGHVVVPRRVVRRRAPEGVAFGAGEATAEPAPEIV